MQKIRLLLFATVLFLLWSCDDYTMSADDAQQSGSGNTIAPGAPDAEKLADIMNSNIANLHEFMALQEKGSLVESVKPFTDEVGEGYKVVFTTLDTVMLYGKLPENGAMTLESKADATGGVPEINMARTEESEQFYWTLNGQFLKDVQGNNIPVSNPYIRLRVNGEQWQYTIDNGNVWLEAGKVGSLELPYALGFKMRGEFTFGNLTFVPEYKPSLGYTVKSDFEISAGEKYRLNYKIDYHESTQPQVTAVSADNWDIKCTVEDDFSGGVVTLTAPLTAKVGQKSSVTLNFVDGENRYTKNIEVLVCKPSAYLLVLQLGEEYSMFREMIQAYDVVDAEGDITNSYMDMYNADGALTWSMRSKDGKTTMLIPSNSVVEAAIEEASQVIRDIFNREPSSLDIKRFKQWILRSCFFDRELTNADFKGTTDLMGVAGYNKMSAVAVEGALWRPTVQKVSTVNPEDLYNGMAYYLEYLHIPVYVVIHRVKSIVSDVFTACGHARNNKDEQPFIEEYFKLSNAILFQRTNNNDGKKAYRHGELVMSDGYIVPAFTGYMCAIYQKTTYDEPATFEIAGVVLDENQVKKVKLPAGDYILSIGTGGRNSGQTFDLYFKWENEADYTLIKADNKIDASYDISGGGYADYHTTYYQELLGMSYPGAKYIDNLDRDGTEVGKVTLTGEAQSFWIKQLGKNLGSSSDKEAMSLFHWTLRPKSTMY